MKLFVLAALCVAHAAAMPSYVARIPGSSNVPGVAAVGHVDPNGGGPRNPFGLDFAAAVREWTVELCYKDSDSDGQFNGAELGDPCCEWVKGSNEKLAYSSASAPGDATSKQNPSIWASVKCANGQDPVTKYRAFLGTPAPAPGPAPGPAPTPVLTPVTTTKAPTPGSTTPAPTKPSTAPVNSC